MTTKKAMATMNGLMEGNSKVGGIMTSNMALGCTEDRLRTAKKIKLNMESGKWAKEYNGLMRRQSNK